ncbi:hypothetical protein HPB51_002924 [Rhipicephalus microplus]|uniref:Uncharacterized protein n=1 Tax=Rhipicephalus microplus TaxID=6941 RepID=A0A9J6DSV1_RHIMP|nr:hypothetical protein HPB51_002924 [Rhipicephalus microplus]
MAHPCLECIEIFSSRSQRPKNFNNDDSRNNSYFMCNEIPKAEKLRNDVINDPDMDMPLISTHVIQITLNNLGFTFRKRTRNFALLERDDIVAWRRKYLRTIREMRKQ